MQRSRVPGPVRHDRKPRDSPVRGSAPEHRHADQAGNDEGAHRNDGRQNEGNGVSATFAHGPAPVARPLAGQVAPRLEACGPIWITRTAGPLLQGCDRPVASSSGRSYTYIAKAPGTSRTFTETYVSGSGSGGSGSGSGSGSGGCGGAGSSHLR